MKKTAFFIPVLLFVILQSCTMGVKEPNIVYIICDQMNPRAMSWLGGTEVKTPHLDQFSESSYCFSNAYCSSPVCAPSRHSFYTGVYPSEHWVMRNDTRMNEDCKTLIQMLNEQGYTTANIGKMHNAPYHNRRDFQFVLNHEFFTGPAGISHYNAFLKSEMKKRKINTYNPYNEVPEDKVWLQVKEGIANVNPLPEDLTPENWMTREALKFMDDQTKNRKNKPFFLHLSYFPPHHPYMPVERFVNMYLKNADELELPPNFDYDRLQRWCRNGKMTPDSLSVEDVKCFRAFYFAFITQLDDAVGKLLDGMKERNLLENTIVIFTADHGDNLGEHGLFYKGNMFEGSVRVPLLIHWPEHKLKKRKLIQDNISNVDLVPTLLSAAGAPIPENLAGKNMEPLMKGIESWDDHKVYSEYYSHGREPTQLMLKKGDFKLIYTTDTEGGDWETYFYNTKNDPWEQNDLFNESEYADILMNYIHELLNDYWNEVAQKRPSFVPRAVPRVKYDIKWPADPWAPVKIDSSNESPIMY